VARGIFLLNVPIIDYAPVFKRLRVKHVQKSCITTLLFHDTSTTFVRMQFILFTSAFQLVQHLTFIVC